MIYFELSIDLSYLNSKIRMCLFVKSHTMSDVIEYVIYVRKSTEDTSGERQAQSIPDQIERCVDYAKKENLLLKMKPENFEFETEEEIRIEDNEKDIKSRRIYQDTRKYYIIKERESAKVTWRPKWNKLINKIRKWEIKWLLSYSPDRQARNMVDWWTLIDCVDCGQVDLKYTNFNFEPNAAWKMMLWMWFVFSKQYSDKLWEDVNRWKKSSVEKGHSQWEYKYWYYRDENKHFVPDGDNFELMKEAFRLKVEKKASDKYIADWLNANGFYKRKWKKKEKVTYASLGKVWIDTFYYWVYVNWQNTTDLRTVEWLNFIPLISEERHNILMDRYLDKHKPVEVKSSERTDEYAFSLPVRMLKTKEWHALVPYITKKKHRLELYEKALQTNPSLKLEKFIESSRVRYELKTNSAKNLKSSKTKDNVSLSVNQDVVEEEIMKVLSKINISDKHYKSYVKYIEDKMDEITKDNQGKQSAINMRIWSLRKERRKYIERNMWVEFKNDEEREIYQEALAEFDDKEKLLQSSLDNIFTTERNMALEFDVLVQTLKRAADTYKNASNVRKKKICKLLFSNIYINNKKKLTIEVNPAMKNILDIKSCSPGCTWNTSNDMRKILNDKAYFAFVKKMIQFYIAEIEPNFNSKNKLSRTQKMIYGIES